MNSELTKEITRTAEAARKAGRVLQVLPERTKNKVLADMARGLLRNARTIIRANKRDLSSARQKGKNKAFLDRLMLDEKRIRKMSSSLKSILALPDPVGKVIRRWRRPNGLLIKKVRVPIGVIAIIYEARPEVSSDSAGLCLKSGNAVILRGGQDAIHSNTAIFNVLRESLVRHKLPQNAVNLITSTDRKAVDILLRQKDFIDVVIPRGGEGLIRLVEQKSRIPVIKHYKGICHTYVDKDADINCARKVVFNAKVQRPGVCNAMETLLVHRDIAKKFLPAMIEKLQAAGVEIRGDEAVCRMASGIKKAVEKDWSSEYLDLILAVKVVHNLEQAIEHINHYGSGHSDAIITDNHAQGEEFMKRVDSACVYLNASTRFTDGYEFGLGAEMGISTDKLHARGPMALEELTTYKYQVLGSGQIRK